MLKVQKIRIITFHILSEKNPRDYRPGNKKLTEIILVKKTTFVFNYSNLKFWIRLGMEDTKLKRVMILTQKTLMKKM